MAQLIVTANSLYKRKSIPVSLPDSDSVAGVVHKGYKFQGTFIQSNADQVAGGWYKGLDNNYYWAGGVSVDNTVASALSSVTAATVSGIDVSRYQNKAINWPQVKSSIDFVYVKATEGFYLIDPLCNAHASGASVAELKIGYYHFAVVSQDAIQQAQHFDKVIKTMPPASLIPVLDVEVNKANLSPAEMESWIITFIRTMNSLDYPQIMLYSYYSFLNQNLPVTHSLGKHPLWLAEYNSKISSPQIPVGWGNFTIWQHNDNGTLKGTVDRVDMNRAIPEFIEA